MLYHFQFELSDIDRSIYKSLDFRIALHPSETLTYLITRALAYALSYTENLEFSPGGLHDPEAPALRAFGQHGSLELWIEVGSPSVRKLHKATKIAKQVIIFTYKNADILIQEIKAHGVHRQDELIIFAMEPHFLQLLENEILKNNRWNILHQQGQLDIDTGSKQFSSLIVKKQLT